MRHIKSGEDSNEWQAGVETLDQLILALQPLQEGSDVAARLQQAGPLVEAITSGMREIGCAEESISDFTEWFKVHVRALARNDLEHLDRPAPFATPMAQDEETQDNAISAHVAAELERLCEGTWLEFVPHSGTIGRCKLATITQPGSVYVFVNRRGMKVMELSRAELARKLEAHEVAILEQTQVFDRALRSVISNLRENQSA